MKYRKLGASDLNVSVISLGSWLTFGVGVEADKTRDSIDRAFDLGVNFIDTANVYGQGAAEAVLGEMLAGRPRDSYIMATKVFGVMSPEDKGLSRAQIIKQMDASLQRLKTDYVDLYQCHRYDPETPLEETMEALTEVVKAGKARYIGFSEWTPAQIEAAAAIPGVERFVSSQPQYSMLYRKPEAEVIPLSAKTGISQIVWSPLAQGVLSGKYLPGAQPPVDSRAASDDMGTYMASWLKDDILTAVQQLKPIAAEAGCTVAQFALAWVLREPNVASAIVGASRPQQMDDNAAAADLVIDPALFARAEAALAGVQQG
ncbi:aldo/keto reductase family protein [Phenylobacterium immobile]|uniref:aldo/keto reductase family protein n=1 Tax=Phenylobacterium immobile TaxID=21 RepID=UPI000ABBFCEC|nr:aldo/keto reductase family protein [Phenylobacterium immobile]